MGLTVHIAENGLKVLELVEEVEHELILMDIQMPEMNGLEATEALQRNDYHKPIIAMTANVMEREVKSYLDKGLKGCIPKPFKSHDIAEALDPYLL
jgi:CheY-like chemotaxis protein